MLDQIALKNNIDNEAEFVHAFGVANVKGTYYYVNSGVHYKLDVRGFRDITYQFVKINPYNQFAVSNFVNPYRGMDFYYDKIMPQMTYYNASNDRIVVAEIKSGKRIRFTSLPVDL